jgi:arylsulfatase A-like enzyme
VGPEFNLIVVMVDSLRQDHLGAYGNRVVRTPAMDQLAHQSLVFERAFPEGLPTVPARRALFTGRRSFPSLDWHPWKGEPVRLRGWQPLRDSDITLAEILRAHGYVCGLVADCHHLFKPGMNFTRGFHAYTHIRGQVSDPFKSGPVPAELVRRYAFPELDEWTRTRVLQYLRNNHWRQREEDFFPARVFGAAAEWLAENRTHERLFLWVDCFDPHEPYDPPQSYVDLYDPGYAGREFICPREGDSSYLSAAELNHCRALYAGEVSLVDAWLGWFLDRVRDLGLWDDTVVLFLSDHGHPLGEHGIISKVPWAIYPELVNVPFMIRIPGRTTSGRTRAMVQFHDVAPTLLEVLGVPAPEGYAFGGQSFVEALTPGGPSPRQHIVCGYHENALVLDDRWAYVFTQEESLRRLYDLQADPGWTQNLYAEQPGVVERMHNLLCDVADPDAIRVDLTTPEGQGAATTWGIEAGPAGRRGTA